MILVIIFIVKSNEIESYNKNAASREGKGGREREREGERRREGY